MSDAHHRLCESMKRCPVPDDWEAEEDRVSLELAWEKQEIKDALKKRQIKVSDEYLDELLSLERHELIVHLLVVDPISPIVNFFSPTFPGRDKPASAYDPIGSSQYNFLNRGGFAEVDKAKGVINKRTVALKTSNVRQLGSTAQLKKAMREVEIHAILQQHPNIVQYSCYHSTPERKCGQSSFTT